MAPIVVSFDYWDTLYRGAVQPERVTLRRAALRRMLGAVGRGVEDDELAALYDASGAEAERWWRDEQRGYTARDRIGWLLDQLAVRRPAGCAHVARAVDAVDAALDEVPAPLLPGAAETVRALAPHATLAVLSDTGFASGNAQTRLLDRDGLRAHFAALVYSCDIGHAKPHRAIFEALLAAVGAQGGQVIHVGNDERTDVRGALGAGLRAVRLDQVHDGGPSEAEFVARSHEEVRKYLLEAVRM